MSELLMPNYICVTCGTEFPASKVPPNRCSICDEERQFVGWDGQKWTTLKRMESKGYKNQIRILEKNLYQIVTRPEFAIGQRAFLLRTSEGNLLWDCLTYLDKSTIGAVRKLGGIRSIAISHPHYYSSMIEWGEALDVQIYIHDNDRVWVNYPSEKITFWTGEKMKLFGRLELINLGGHFDGATVLHWPDGYEGRGVLLSGDTIQVVPDRNWVSFMYSYPNLIPLSAKKVLGIADQISNYEFDRIYGAFERREVMSGAKGVVKRSAERYASHLND